MKRLLRLQIGLVTAVLFTLISASPVAAGIGISPASLLNNRLKPGTTFRQEINISQSDPVETLEVTVEPDIKDINSWFSFEPGSTFQIAQGQTNATVTMVVNIPQGAVLGDYSGYIRIKAAPASAASAGGVSVVKGARLDVTLSVTEIDNVELLVRSIESKPIDQKGVIVLGLKIENKGNVAAAPTRVEMAVEDLNLNPIETFSTNELEEIQVSETKEIQARFNNNLPAGEYFANVKVFLGDVVLREEKIILRIEEGNSTNPGAEVTVDNRLLISAGILLGGVIIMLIITSSVLRKMTLIPNSKKRFITAIVLIVFICLTSILLYLILYYNRPAEGNVQGISTLQPTTIAVGNRNLIVADLNSVSRKYLVYENADSGSTVLYEVLENEQFLVLEETADWYKISIGGAEGWLRKMDVKRIDQTVTPD